MNRNARLLCLLATLVLTCGWGGIELQIAPQPNAGGRIAPNPIPARLHLPSGSGPFPALVVLHTCGGLSHLGMGGPSLVEQWVRRVNGWGYAALVPDSFAPRGVSSICSPEAQPKVTAWDRAGDAVSAALALRGRPEIDAQRIAVIGFSHGGATAARAALTPAATAFPGLIRAAVAYYGSCGPAERYGGVPLLVLVGEADDWGNPAASCRLFAERLGAGAPVEIVTYPGVAHSFDNRNLVRRTFSFGHRVEYDHAAAEDSFARVKAFLARTLN